MSELYNCKTDGDHWRITKFNGDMEVQSSYLCTTEECDCPAGVRPSCRHRVMIHKFLSRNAVNTNWFLDYDRDGWVQTDLGEALSGSVEELDLNTAGNTTVDMITFEDVAKAKPWDTPHPFHDNGEDDDALRAELAHEEFLDCDDQTPPAKPFRRGL